MQQPKLYGPYKHGDIWRVHIVTGSGGSRSTRYRSFATRELAEHYINSGRSAASGATVRNAVDALLADMRKEGLAESTIETAEFRLWHFFQVARHGERAIRWLNRRGEELYEAAQVNRKADTHQAELALAKQVGELCVKRRWLRENPFADVVAVGRKTHGSTKPRLRVDESRKLREHCLQHATDPHYVITLAYLLLGSRASEMVKRDVRDLDDGGRLLWISRTKTVGGARRVVIPDELRVLLLEMVKGRASNTPLFVTDAGKRADRHWAYRHVRRICKEAGVPVLSPQALRRTQSDLATDAGETAIAVARHLGQTSSVVTDRSYRDPNVVRDAKQERAFKVLAGGAA